MGFMVSLESDVGDGDDVGGGCEDENDDTAESAADNGEPGDVELITVSADGADEKDE